MFGFLAKELDDYRQISHSSFKSAVAAISERFLDLAIPDSKCDGTREMHNEGAVQYCYK